jgi:hypothetical protein
MPRRTKLCYGCRLGTITWCKASNPMTDSTKPRTLKDQLESETAETERSAAVDSERYHGGDWWQLTDAEESVFVIDRERFPRIRVFAGHSGRGNSIVILLRLDFVIFRKKTPYQMSKYELSAMNGTQRGHCLSSAPRSPQLRNPGQLRRGDHY